MMNPFVHIEPFQEKHMDECLELFDSNCPPYFDTSERILFANFLKSLITGIPSRETIKDNVFFILYYKGKISACGGYYSNHNSDQIRFSWGMVRNSLHRKGMGRILVRHRIDDIKRNFKSFQIALDTSQFTEGFYSKLGFVTIDVVQNGYAVDLHKYEMLLKV